jgi:hypothetical protein
LFSLILTGVKWLIARPLSYRLVSSLVRSNSDGVFDRGHEDLSIANLAGFGRFQDGRHDGILGAVGDNYLDLDFRKEVDRVFASAIDFGVAFLAAEAFHLGHRHAFNANLPEGVFDLLKLERLYDRFDFLHSFMI